MHAGGPVVDFTWHIAQECAQLGTRATRVVPSSTTATRYTVTLRGDVAECTCPGFKFHGRCKHAAAEAAKVCSWSSEHDGGQSPQQNMEMVCPRCKGPTHLARVAA